MSDRLPKKRKRAVKKQQRKPEPVGRPCFDFLDCPWISDDTLPLKLVLHKEDCGEDDEPLASIRLWVPLE